MNLTIVRITADGGILERNPGGFGYGSFQTFDNYESGEPCRREYGREHGGHPMTNIVAEILTCIEALDWLAEQGPSRAMDVRMHNDCQWVVRHLTAQQGSSRKPHLRALHARWSKAIARFGRVQVDWHPREASVAVLGH